MSAPGLIALVGNLLATVSILPHLVQAIRDRRPTGSAYGWGLGGINAGLWLAYGWTTHQPEIGAPGYLTLPVSGVLGVWAWRAQRATRRAAATQVDLRAVAADVREDVELAA